MRKRFKLSRSRSKKLFRRSANRIHHRNSLRRSPMRGGIRF